jgi:uncharacterized protein DUF4879
MRIQIQQVLYLVAFCLFCSTKAIVADFEENMERANCGNNNADLPLVQLAPVEETQKPAPPLTHLFVYFVVSEFVPQGEKIEEYQFSTKLKHGGTYSYVKTVEIGYGQNSITKINGHTSSMISEKALCQGPDGIEFCRPGGEVIGFARTWDISAYGNGLFHYQSTSINAPWNTMTKELTIQ